MNTFCIPAEKNVVFKTSVRDDSIRVLPGAAIFKVIMQSIYYVIENCSSFDTLKTLFGKTFAVRPGSRSESRITLWDSYDTILLNRDLAVFCNGRRWRLWNIGLWKEESLFISRGLPGKSPKPCRVFGDSDFGDKVKKLLGIRSLIRHKEFLLSEWDISLLNRDSKIVVKLSVYIIDTMSLVILRPLRGYEQEASEADKLLKEREGRCSFKKSMMNFIARDITVFAAPDNKNIFSKKILLLRDTAAAIVVNYLKVIRFYEEGVISDFDPECLHQYRVAMRKIRCLLSIIKGIFPGEELVRLKNDFKEIQQATNRLRDLDVNILEEEHYTALLPDGLEDEIKPLFMKFRRDRKKEFGQVSSFLSSRQYQKRITDLTGYFQKTAGLSRTEHSHDPVRPAVKTLIGKLYKKISSEIKVIHDDTPDDAIHRLRIGAKKMRYLLEFFAPILDKKRLGKLLLSLKNIQDILGTYNDLSVHICSLTGHKRAPNASSTDTMITGVLIGVLYSEKKLMKKRLIKKIKDFTGKSVQNNVNKLIENM